MVKDVRAGRLAAALVHVAVGILYAATAARYVLGGDNGELVAVGATGGVAHPPGYPLYALLLRASLLVPVSSPAHAAALVTAAIATFSVFALAWAARAWGASRLSSTAAAALFAVAPLSWKLGTHAEVFSLNVALAMLIVGWASPRQAPPFGREALRAALLGLLAGLGLSNHHSIVLLAPIGLFAAVRAVILSGERLGARLRTAAGAVLALAVGLSPYVSLVVRTRATPIGQGCIWGAPRDLSGVIRHFLRTDYGTFQLAISNAEPAPVAHLSALARTLFLDLFGAPLLLFVAAVALVRASRARPRASVAAYAAHVPLGLSFLLAGPAFVARFNLPARSVGALVTERFHLLPLALLSIFVALALDAVLAASTQPDEDRGGRRLLLVAGGLAGLVLARAAFSYPIVREHHRPTTELYLRNVLSAAPADAIILASGDDRTGGFMYTRCALGLRPDVEVIAPHLLLSEWYPDQVSARLGLRVVRGERQPGAAEPVLSARELLSQLVATGRPVFVTDWFARGLDASTPSYPIGPMIRVVPRRSEVPDPLSLMAANDEVFAKLNFEPTLPARGTWGGTRMSDYARPWAVLAQAFTAAGDATRAEECRQRAFAFTTR